MTMNDIVELSKRFVMPMAAVRKGPLSMAPRMTMARLPQWVIEAERDDSATDSPRTDVPMRMTMSKPAPVARTTIGRQR